MTTVEEAKRAIDLIGLEYPADIEATYNDLPADLGKLITLREHLYYLYTYGSETKNDDMADYALFANLHVRYRILQFHTDLSPADAYYRRVYELKLPRMKWSPFKHATQHEELVIIEEAEEVIVSEPSEIGIAHLVPCEVILQDAVVHDLSSVAPVMEPVLIALTDQLPAKDLEGHKSWNSEYTDWYYNHRLSPITITSIGEFGSLTHVVRRPSGLGGFHLHCVVKYGIPIRIINHDAKRFALLFHHITGRFSGYDDAGYYISAVQPSRHCSLFALALRQLSRYWFRPPSP